MGRQFHSHFNCISIPPPPPDVSIRSDRQLIQSLRSISSEYSHKVVVGDWNADMLTPTNSDTRFLNNLMNDLSLKLIDTGASHHTNINTWIDTIFVDECDTILKYDRFLPPFPSRHDIITTMINVFYPLETNNSYTRGGHARHFGHGKLTAVYTA